MKRAFFGGVHPKGYKELSREAAIVPLHPSVVSVAMSQHIGAPCQPLVKVGDRVTVGQKIGDGQGLCVPVHASVSGTVTAIEARPHPGGNLQTAIVIESDGRDTLCPTVKPRDPEAVAAMSAEDLIAVIREAGITGMGGAGFPTSVKLSSGLGKVDTVIVNGAECEPYITSDDRLMRETPERVVGGLRVVLQILQPKRAAIGIEQYTLRTATIKGNNALTCYSDKDRHETPNPHCIRCGKCVEACPMHLMPLFLHRAVNRGDLERLDELHVMDCIECGSCAYGCPAGIPLVQSFRTGKKLVRDAAAREKAKKEAAAK